MPGVRTDEIALVWNGFDARVGLTAPGFCNAAKGLCGAPFWAVLPV